VAVEDLLKSRADWYRPVGGTANDWGHSADTYELVEADVPCAAIDAGGSQQRGDLPDIVTAEMKVYTPVRGITERDRLIIKDPGVPPLTVDVTYVNNVFNAYMNISAKLVRTPFGDQRVLT
jgi:hypothetical protein